MASLDISTETMPGLGVRPMHLQTRLTEEPPAQRAVLGDPDGVVRRRARVGALPQIVAANAEVLRVRGRPFNISFGSNALRSMVGALKSDRRQ